MNHRHVYQRLPRPAALMPVPGRTHRDGPAGFERDSAFALGEARAAIDTWIGVIAENLDDIEDPARRSDVRAGLIEEAGALLADGLDAWGVNDPVVLGMAVTTLAAALQDRAPR